MHQNDLTSLTGITLKSVRRILRGLIRSGLNENRRVAKARLRLNNKAKRRSRPYDSPVGGALKTVVLVILLAFIVRASFREII